METPNVYLRLCCVNFISLPTHVNNRSKTSSFYSTSLNYEPIAQVCNIYLPRFIEQTHFYVVMFCYKKLRENSIHNCEKRQSALRKSFTCMAFYKKSLTSFKDARHVSFGQNCLHLLFKPYVSSKTYSLKHVYENKYRNPYMLKYYRKK